MTPIEEQLRERGFDEADIAYVSELIEQHTQDLAIAQAAQFLHVVFLRVERDSVAGCALRRALGFSGGESLSRAAKAFGVTKQYVHDVQAPLEAKLGDLTLGVVESVKNGAEKIAGPSAGSRLNR